MRSAIVSATARERYRMHRALVVLLGIALVLSLLAPGGGVPRVDAQNDASAEVPMFRGNAARTGEMPGPGPDLDGEIGALWSFQTQRHGGRPFRSSPRVAYGTIYIGNDDGNLYAIDAVSGQQRWSFETGGWALPSLSSPAVVDGVVYVGGYDGHLYAIDAATGQQRWSFEIGLPDLSSPAVVDGVVYVGSNDGHLYAIGNLTPRLQAVYATATAETAAGMDRIATAVAQEQAWPNYLSGDLSDAFAATVQTLPGIAYERSILGPTDSFIPEDYLLGARYDVAITGGAATAWVDLIVLPSSEDAANTMQSLGGGLIRSGWESADVKGLKHDHSCLSIVYADSSQAVCYVTRDDVLIVSYSEVQIPKADAALLNVTDLARAMSDAYDQVDRPDRTG